MRSPLRRVGALKLKFGLLLGGGVVATVVLVLVGTLLGLPLVATGGLALVGGLLVVDLLADGLTGPLREMAARAGDLAAGRPVEPVTTDARDEVGELATAFNHMAAEIALTDQLRREVVANASHELRTPLAALGAVLDNLEDGVQSRAAAVPLLRAQTDRLTSLVERLLDLSQLDAGATTLDRAPTPLGAVVDRVVARLAGPARGRIRVDVPVDLVLELDADRFEQVLENLVTNALRHGPAGTPVLVRAGLHGDVVRLRVVDEGPGISRADAERIFDRFVRADDGRTTTTGGAGLGLAITRWIVELHGGDVRVEHPGRPGARLLVELPVTTTAAVPPPPPATSRPPAVRSGDGAPPPPPGASSPGPSGVPGLPRGFAAALSGRQLAAVGVASVAASCVPFVAPGIGLAVVLLVCVGATVDAVERALTPLARVVVGSAVVVVVWWAVSDAQWLLVPASLVLVVLTGFAFWDPDRAGEAFRAALVGPLLTLAAPVALVSGLRGQPTGRLRRVVVPALATVAVLVVFGALLASAEPRMAALAERLIDGLALDGAVLLRGLVAVVAAVGVVTHVLVDRVGAQPSPPWARPVRPRTDWLVPLVALDALLLLYVVLEVDLLLGVVGASTGVTLADAAREGFGQLVVVAALVLAVVGVVSRVAADVDRRVRDLAAGTLLGLTAVVLTSAALRLAGYVEAFGLTRLRLLAAWALLVVAVVLVLVVVASRRPTGVALTRQVLATLAVGVALLVVASPDTLIAVVNVDRAERGAELDVGYLRTLSADAVPTLVDVLDLRRSPELCDALPRGFAEDGPAAANVARSRARASLAACLP